MNIKLLRKIQRKILKEPRQFQMGFWFTKSPEIPNCHTAACIAGWAISCANKVKPSVICDKLLNADMETGYIGSEHSTTVSKRAAKLLQLTKDESNRLFLRMNWPYQFVRIWQAGTPEYAQNAVKRIDHFIATEGRE